MSIKAYVGLPRAGKSYEVVVNVIIPAIAQGRRVVSNIAGLNFDAIKTILFSDGLLESQIGSLVSVSHDEVVSPFFWRTDTDAARGVDAFIQPGDLVALDEIWRFWKKRGAIHYRVMNFMRMHGHFVHPDSGFTCDVALITQNVKDINENIRDVTAETYQAVKNTKVGSNKSFIVHVFQKGSTAKTDHIRTLPPRMYDSKYFACYSSHSQKSEGSADAKEKNPDSRGNILHGPLIKFFLPLSFLILITGIFLLKNIFSSHAPLGQKPDIAIPDKKELAPAKKPDIDLSKNWRVVGWYRAQSVFIVYLINQQKVVRVLQNPPNFKMSGAGVEVQLPEGGFATPWTAIESRGLI